MNNKIKSYIFISMFFLMILAPQLIGKVLGGANENSENRTLAEKPDFLLSEWDEYPARYEEYYNDNIPYKSKFIWLNQIINYTLFDTAENDKCLLGKEEWLFFKGDNTIEDYQGTLKYSDEQLMSIVEQIMRVDEYYKTKGIEFVLFIAPNKESIYGEYLPDKYVQFNDNTRANQLYDYLVNNTSVQVIFPKEELRGYKDEYELYYKYDTHWNDIGAYVSAAYMGQCLRNNVLKPIENTTVINNGMHIGDLATMLNLTSYFYDEPELKVDNVSNVNVETVYSIPHSIVFNEKYISDNQNGKKIYIIGDSFSAQLAKYAKYNYTECTVIHRNEYKAGTVEDEGVDVVVCEFVERYIDQMVNAESIFIPIE